MDRCEGCNNRIEALIPACTKYAMPARQHSRVGGCPFDTRREAKKEEEFKLNPLKQSKRSMGK